MHDWAEHREETKFGNPYWDESSIPAIAALAFSVLAAIRSRNIATPASLRSRLPIAWRPTIAPAENTLEECRRKLQQKAIDLTKSELLKDMRQRQASEHEDEDEAPATDKNDDAFKKTKQNAIHRRLAALARACVNTGINLLDYALE